LYIRWSGKYSLYTSDQRIKMHDFTFFPLANFEPIIVWLMLASIPIIHHIGNLVLSF
jgi:hypothetical protein